MKHPAASIVVAIFAGLLHCGCGGGGGGGAGGGNASTEIAFGAAADSGGNVYLAGFTDGSVDGGSSLGGEDIFVVKYDPDGNRLWTAQLGTGSDDRANAIATDNNGNVYVAGFSDYTGTRDLLLVKLDGDGGILWSGILGTAGNTVANGVATDRSGNVYVVGSTNGSLDGKPYAGATDLFVLKIDGDGNLLWSRQMGTAASDEANGVSVDNAGNVYVAGFTGAGLDGNPNAGGIDLFVVKYDTDGNRLWTRQMGTSQSDCANGVVADGNGNVFVAGYTYGGLDGNSNAGSWDIFVVKYDTDGNRQWTRQFGSSREDTAGGIAVDGGGNLFVTGTTLGGLDGNTSAGTWDIFLMKLDNAGTRQWTRQWGTGSDDMGYGVVTDGSGNVSLSGSSWTNGGVWGGAWNNDYVYLRYDSAGNRR